ncbi:MAG: fumarylacetoacetate hydrolase family protein [Alphaproteobacteria bacterium]
MRLASYQYGGRSRYGVVNGDRIQDLTSADGAWPDLKSALTKCDWVELAALAARARETHDAARVEYLPVIPNPGKIMCAGVNYPAHILGDATPAKYPSLFIRVPSSLVGHNAPVVKPPESDQYDYEGELAVIIGKPGRRISEADALKHVAGYTCANDGSARDWQRHAGPPTAGKNFERSGSIGPWLASPDEVGDPAALTLVTRINDVERQRDSVGRMHFSVPQLIVYISTITTLETGDIILTGSPTGTGFSLKPPIFLAPGDAIEIEIERVGTLRNAVVAETTA